MCPKSATHESSQNVGIYVTITTKCEFYTKRLNTANLLTFAMAYIQHVQNILQFQGKKASLDRYDGSCGRKDVKIISTVESVSYTGTYFLLSQTYTIKEDIRSTDLYVR